MTRLRWLAAAVMTAALTFACGGSPKPVSQMSSSEAAIRGASEAGAQSVPQAKLHLTMAQEQHDKGVALVEDDENAEAAAMFERAQADAELAIALSRAARAAAEAQSAQSETQQTVKENAQ